jgi:3-isopropylmalate/(R)-2-methylmalate dehydratase small subunit
MNYRGRAHKFGDLINTDIHCSSKYLPPGVTRDEIIQNIFVKIRPGFPQEVSEGDFLIAGTGFGTVSSREEAPTLLKILGIRAVLAKSFGYLFYRNAINVGLPIIECDTDLIENGDLLEVDFLSNSITNRTKEITLPAMTKFSREILSILEDGGLINHLVKHGGYAIG